MAWSQGKRQSKNKKKPKIAHMLELADNEFNAAIGHVQRLKEKVF